MTYRVFLKSSKTALHNFEQKTLCIFPEIAFFIPQLRTENRFTLFLKLLYEVILNSRLTTMATANYDPITQIGNEARQNSSDVTCVTFYLPVVIPTN